MPPPTVTETIIGRACRALVLENNWLSTTILLDQGANIHTQVYKPKGVDVLWKPPRPPRETADLDGEATHGLLMHAADLGAQPIPELEFDQTLGQAT